MSDDTLYVDLCEAIAWKVFDGRYPANVSAQLLAVAILNSLPAFQDADVEVRKHFLVRMTPLIALRRVVEANAAIVDYTAEWKS